MPKHRNITRDGNLKDGRIFKLATYILPRHPTRLYMLASDLAKEFGFRDSFLLFQRTQGLFRLVATDADKLFLINHLKVLPRMRKYAPVPIVSAKSAFRVFGHKLIQNGLPDIDQYYSLQDTDTESVMSSENEADVVSFIEPVVNVPLTEQGKEQVFKRAVNSALEFNSILNRNRLQEFYDVHTNILQVPKNTQIESVVLQYKPHNSLVIDDQVSIKNDSQEWKSIPITKKKYPLSLIPGQKRDLISLYNTEFTQIDAERLQSLKKPRPEIQESEKYICGHANVNGTTCRRTVPKNELCYIHISSKSIELCNICSEIDNSDDVYGVLVTCISCRFKHHPVCVGITESLTVSKIVGYDWSCPTCKKCDKCNLGDGELINCNVCDRAAHSTCIQSQKYTCQECMKCYGCGNNKVTENIHVQSPSPTFIAGFCISCASLFNAGKFCHLCIKVYKNTNDVPLLSCDECDRYVHVACDDSLVGSTYQEYLDDDEKKYKCVICRGQKGIKMVEIQEKLCLVP